MQQSPSFLPLYPPTALPQYQLRNKSEKAQGREELVSEARHAGESSSRLSASGRGGGVRLEVKGDGRRKTLRFKGMGRNDPELKLEQLRPPAVVFPPTRPPPARTPVDLPPVEIAEASKRYLDSHPSLMHVPFDLVYDTLREDKTSEESSGSWDPYAGNCVEATWAKLSGRNPKVGLVAFPMGEVGQELNVSPIHVPAHSGRKRTTYRGDIFTPTARPVATFKTPIFQIATSPAQLLDTTASSMKPHVAIRTSSSTSFLSLTLTSARDPTSLPVVPSELSKPITREDTKGRQHMHVALSPWNVGEALVVDDQGGVWEWGARTEKIISRRSNRIKQKSSSKTLREFHRIAYAQSPLSALLLSYKTLSLLDFRAPSSSSSASSSQPTPLHDIAPTTACLTSLDRKQSPNSQETFGSSLVGVCSTEAVSWVDVRMPGRVVLSFDHRRAFDRSLEMTSFESDDITTTLLTSRQTRLVTSYTTSSSSSYTATHSLHPPYIIPSATFATSSNPFTTSDALSYQATSSTLFRHPTQPAGLSTISLFELSPLGSLSLRKLGLPSSSPLVSLDDEDGVGEGAAATFRGGRPNGTGRKRAEIEKGFEWLPEMKRLVERAEKKLYGKDVEGGVVGQDDGMKGRIYVDLREVYEESFSLRFASPLEDNEDTNPTAGLISTCSNMSTFLRESDTLSDKVLLPREIAHYSCSNTPPSTRSDFLAPQPPLLPPAGALSSLSPHLPSLDSLSVSSSNSRRNFKHTLSSSVPTLSKLPLQPFSSPSELSTALHNHYGLKPFTPSQPHAIRTASAAIDALSLDLILCTQFFFPEPILPPPSLDDDDELERATQALSISNHDLSLDQAPALHFSFFKPVLPKIDLSGQAGEMGRIRSLAGSGTARLLMSQWIVGEDPAEYRHTDLRTTDENRPSRHGASASQFDSFSQAHPSQSQRPPVVQASQPSYPQSQSQRAPTLQLSQRPPTIQVTQPPTIKLTQPPSTSQRRAPLPTSSQRFSSAISQARPPFAFTSLPPASSQANHPPPSSSQPGPSSSSQPYPHPSQGPLQSQSPSQSQSQPVGIPMSPASKRRFPPSASYNASESLPLPQRPRPNAAASSPWNQSHAIGFSQDPEGGAEGGTSTQPMRGPFGGRPSLGGGNGGGGKGKKSGKKRIGGF